MWFGVELHVHDEINEPQLPWLQTALCHTGLDVKMKANQCTSVQHPMHISSTPNVHQFNTQCTSVQHPMHISSTPNAHQLNTQCTSAQHPMHISSTPNAHQFNIQCTSVQHPMHISSTPNEHQFNIQCTLVQHPMHISSTPNAHQFNTKPHVCLVTHHSLLTVAMSPDLRKTKSASCEGMWRAVMATVWPAWRSEWEKME